MPPERIVTRIAAHSSPVEALASSHDAARLFSSADDSAICVWDARSGALARRVDVNHRVTGLTVSPDGRRLAVQTSEATMDLRDLDSDGPPRRMAGVAVGEHALPPGTWVVAAGNRAQDRALVRALSSALVNRVIILNIRVDVKEWLAWGRSNGVRGEILAFITFQPEALMRPVPAQPIPFSTPRAWASLSQALDLAEASGLYDRSIRRALAFGRVTAEDAAIFCAMAEEGIAGILPPRDYIESPDLLPAEDAARWFILCRIRSLAQRGELNGVTPATINQFLRALPAEHRFTVLLDLAPQWGALGPMPPCSTRCAKRPSRRERQEGIPGGHRCATHGVRVAPAPFRPGAACAN